MNGPARVLVSLALALALAGCLNPGPASIGTGTLKPALPPFDPSVKIPLDAARAVAEIKSFSDAFGDRRAESAQHKAAREYLAKELADMGYEVVRQHWEYRGNLEGVNILGIHWGTIKDEWVVVTAHYDTTPTSDHGAYDDASGTMLVLELARAFAKIPTGYTVVFAPLDGEEVGLSGARAFVTEVNDGTLLGDRFPQGIDLRGNIDIDMAGLTYPLPPHLILTENSPLIASYVDDIRHDIGFPDSHFEKRRIAGGSSDFALFMDAGVATAFFISDFDDPRFVEGQPTFPQGTLPAAVPNQLKFYPFWHWNDRYETMVLAAGGDVPGMTAGFGNVLKITSQLLLKWANDGTWDPEAQETGRKPKDAWRETEYVSYSATVDERAWAMSAAMLMPAAS